MFVLLITSTFTLMSAAVLSPVVELLRIDQGLTATAAGLVVTVHAATFAAVSPFAGRAVDRWGARRPLATGLLLFGVVGAAGLVVEAYPLLIVTRLISGVGLAFVYTGTMVALLDRYDDARRDRAMGRLAFALGLGGVVWPLIGGGLGVLSWHASFAVFLVGVPLAMLAWRLPERPHRPSPARRSRSVTRNPALLGVYLLHCVTSALFNMVLVFLPMRLADIGVTSPIAAALFTAAPSVTMSAAGLAYLRLRARLGYGGLLRLAFGAWAVALLALAVGDIPVIPLGAVAVVGGGMGILVPSLAILACDLVQPTQRGQATSLLATAGCVGQLAAPLVFGPLEQVSAGFLVGAGLAAVASWPLSRLVAPRRRDEAAYIRGEADPKPVADTSVTGVTSGQQTGRELARLEE